LIFTTGFAQYSIEGKVVDSKTQEPIPYTNILIQHTYRGTSTNELGEFLIKLDTLPRTLIISHLNYHKKNVVVNGPEELIVALTPKVDILREVVIGSEKSDPWASELLRKAYTKTRYQAKDQGYGKAIYRQKTRNDSSFFELYEIFYDIKYSNQGILEWAVQEGRYALKKGGTNQNYVYNKNFTLLSKLFTTYQPPTDYYIMPIHPEVDKYYFLQVHKRITIEDREVAVIQFVPWPEIQKPALWGEVFIDIDNYEILKIKGKIIHDDFKMIQITGKENWENYEVTFELAFLPVQKSLRLDYIQIQQEFDYRFPNDQKQKISTSALLSFYQYYQPTKPKRLGGRLTGRRGDAEKLDRLGYNKDFWDENPIVKRTPVEKEVIEAFESEKAFGSIYLNQRKTLSLEQTGITNDKVLKNLISQIDELNKHLDQKVYLHLDKSFYTSGENIRFKAYLVDQVFHQLDHRSGTLNVELISPMGVLIKKFYTAMEKGVGYGDILIPHSLSSGNYILRSNTNWMQNFDKDRFFTTTIIIYNPELRPEKTKINHGNRHTKIDLQFFPEGGYLVADIISQLAFKATDENGRGLDIRGKIVDKHQNVVTKFKSFHHGMGAVYFKPGLNNQYFALVETDTSEMKFPLPAIQENGFILTVNPLLSNVIKIVIRSSPDHWGQNYYLIGQSRGQSYYHYRGKIEDGVAMVEIPKSKFPSGIMHLTLFDQIGIPRCERLVFINHHQDYNVAITSQLKPLKPRQKVDLKLNITQPDGSPAKANLSISVVDSYIDEQSPAGADIYANLLLTSELKGTIENPLFYFKDQEKSTQRALDLLLLTQGQVVREFYSPNYESSKSRSILENRKTTVFWDPDIKLDASGNTTASFYNSDKAKKLRVRIEGISESGHPISFEQLIGDTD